MTTSWDKEVTGLHTITRGERCSYYLYYRTKEGRQRRSKLGDFKVLSLSQARDLARKILAQVLLGGDPFGEMRIARGEHTIQDVYDELWQNHYSKKTTSRWPQEVAWNWGKHLEKAFANRKISKITAPDIHEWHVRYEASPYAGNRSKAVLSKIFSYAETRGYVPPNSNPCRAVPNHPEKKRLRYATISEMHSLGIVLESLYSQFPREVTFIYLLVFTGSRPSAIERSTWNNLTPLNHEGMRCGILHVQGKRGMDVIVLPPQVMTKLERFRGFPTLTGCKFPRELWKRVREEAGCPDLWARDWRRTFATTGLSTGISLGALQELLNHGDLTNTKRYAKLWQTTRLKEAVQIGNLTETYMTGSKLPEKPEHDTN